MSRPLSDEEREAARACVRAMKIWLDDVLAGQRTRAELVRSMLAMTRPGRLWGSASSVHASLLNADERDEDGALLLARFDLEEYRRWLQVGDAFQGAQDEFAAVAVDIDTLGKALRCTPVRWWLDGIGWVRSFEFAAASTGRRFAVKAYDRVRSFVGLEITDNDPQGALRDLQETLATHAHAIKPLAPQRPA